MTLKKEMITPRQMKQFGRFIEDAAWKAIEIIDLDKYELQSIIEHGNEVQRRIIDAIGDLVNYMYPARYHAKGIEQQINILREFFPGLGSADKKIAKRPLPEGAEAWFAIPRWENIASTYNQAVQKVLEAIKKQRNGKLEIFCKLEPGYLRQHSHKIEKLQLIAEQQKGYDILVIPAQFGLRYKGRSSEKIREIIKENEFGLGAYEGAIMLLTHPERLVAYRNLFFDCPGDDITDEVNNFSKAGFPWFLIDGLTNQLKLTFGRHTYASSGNGYITGFLAK